MQKRYTTLALAAALAVLAGLVVLLLLLARHGRWPGR